MEQLLKKIEKENLTLSELITKTEGYFDTSHELRSQVIPTLEKAYCDISQDNKELFEMGETCIESQYYYSLNMTFKDFEETFKDDVSCSDIKDIYLANARNIFEMEKTKYLFRAYKRVLSDKLGMLDYNYSHSKDEWL